MDIPTRLDKLEALVNRLDERLRPKKRKNPSPTISFNATPEMHKQLKDLATQLGVSRSEVMRYIVAKELKIDTPSKLLGSIIMTGSSPNNTLPIDKWGTVAGIPLERNEDNSELLDFS